MPPLAYFGIESSGLNLIIDLLILFAAVLYFSLIYWTYADARRRIVDPIMIGFATVVAFAFPFLGAIIYLILRPPEYLEDVRERELETQAAAARVWELEQGRCPHCEHVIERDFIRCPGCLRKLKEPCVSCSRPLDRAWTICPYCEAEVATTPQPSRRVARRRATGKQLEGERAELRSATADEEPRPARLAATEQGRSGRGQRASRPDTRPRPS
jgi:Double zinc ribbon